MPETTSRDALQDQFAVRPLELVSDGCSVSPVDLEVEQMDMTAEAELAGAIYRATRRNGWIDKPWGEVVTDHPDIAATYFRAADSLLAERVEGSDVPLIVMGSELERLTDEGPVFTWEPSVRARIEGESP